jgi:hypothetical protein
MVLSKWQKMQLHVALQTFNDAQIEAALIDYLQDYPDDSPRLIGALSEAADRL